MKELQHAKNPAIFCSFGKDSLLVLRMALDAGFTGLCYYFGDTLNALAQQMVIDNDLTVYSWPATNRYVVPDCEGWAQVDEYLLGDQLLPILSPITRGQNCEHMNFTRRFTRTFSYPHDVTLTGYKRSDENAAIGISFPREFQLGTTRIVNPLYDWSDDQVIGALGFTPEEESVEYCNECLGTLQHMDRDAALAGFRSRFQLNHQKETRNNEY